ncbi:hypothetical protein BJY24_001041 [Nocardia transvalensis]|uniref:Uncharacterized protein n=1 Tax=Nocardia transvalensis TaxID=37333 RepID=A0A7W9P9U9_9NOCA|nr:hypothetical protein [Nocardia transvalensis]MBB5912174.1 hypothetical protein [Nocardia transvalensis]
MTDLPSCQQLRHDWSVTSPPSTPEVDALVVFLSAALDTDIEPAKTMLAENGFDSIQWTQLPAEGLAKGLPEILGDCAGLVAIIDRTSVAPAVLLEIGAALGRGLPVVVLAMKAEAAESLPPVLRELAVVVAQGNRSASGVRLAETLRALLELQSSPSSSQALSVPDQARSASMELVESAFAGQVEEVVAGLLLNKGARIVATPKFQVSEGRAFIPDLAIWVDRLPHPGFNPVFVEVAGTYWDGRDLVNAFSERIAVFRDQMAIFGCVLGLVVTRDERPVSWYVDDKSAIAVMGLDVLAEQDLVRLLSDGRNRWVHGYR